jgi:hypothetical protein
LLANSFAVAQFGSLGAESFSMTKFLLVSLFAAFGALWNAMLSMGFFASPARLALPSSATDIHECWSNNLNGDFIRCLRATMPESDVSVYAANLGLTQKFDPVSDGDLNLDPAFMGKPDWWQAHPPNRATYFKMKRGESRREVLSYANGFAYYLVERW